MLRPLVVLPAAYYLGRAFLWCFGFFVLFLGLLAIAIFCYFSMARHRAVRIGLDSRHDETAFGMEGINSYTSNLHQRIYLCMPRVSHVSRVSYIQLMYIPVFRWSASWVCMCIPRVYAPINDPSCYPSNLNPGFLSNACVIICLEISPAMPSHWGSSNFVDDGGGAVFNVTGTPPFPSQPSFQHFRRSPFPGSPRGGYMQWNTSSTKYTTPALILP